MKRIICLITIFFSVALLFSCTEVNNGDNNNNYPDGVEQEDKNEQYNGSTPYHKVAREIKKNGTYLYNEDLNGIGYELELSNDENGRCYLWLCVRVVRFVWEYEYGKTTRILFFKLTEEVLEKGIFVTTFKEMYHRVYKEDFFSYTTLNRSEYKNNDYYPFEYATDEYVSSTTLKSLNEACFIKLDLLMQVSFKYLELHNVTSLEELGFTSYKLN